MNQNLEAVVWLRVTVSRLDVFVVAILVLTIKSTGIAHIKVGDGFFLFFISVMLTQFASLWTGKVVSHLEA